MGCTSEGMRITAAAILLGLAPTAAVAARSETVTTVPVGGGVGRRPGLLELVHREVLDLVNGYLDAAAVNGDIASYIQVPGLASRAGVLGALALAQLAT
jgi:hypothetical protein